MHIMALAMFIECSYNYTYVRPNILMWRVMNSQTGKVRLGMGHALHKKRKEKLHR